MIEEKVFIEAKVEVLISILFLSMFICKPKWSTKIFGDIIVKIILQFDWL